MAHFNSIGVFMPYTEENLDVDFRLTGTVSTCATYILEGIAVCSWDFCIKNPFVDRMITAHTLTVGDHSIMQVSLPE